MKTRILVLTLLTALLLGACAAPAANALPPARSTPETQTPQASAAPAMSAGSLEDVLAACDGYACVQNDGVKYWLDTKEGLKLHCWMISGDPDYYEKVYTADLQNAEFSKGVLRLAQLLDGYGFPLRGLKELRFAFSADAVTMTADVDETKLAGGAGDNLLNGEYRFTPWEGPHTPPVRYVAREPFGELILPANGYASLDNGVIRFWLDTADGLKLHHWYLDETPAYVDRVYTVSPDKAGRHGDWITASELLDEQGKAIPGLRALSLLFREGSVLMSVTMDPALSEGAEDVLPGGQFLFSSYSGSYIPPVLDGKQPEVSAYDGYTCTQGDEILFWLESTGARLNLTLHCFFSDGALRYERVYHIDSERAFFRGQELIVQDLFDMEENSVWKDRYGAMSFRFGKDKVLMHVEQANQVPEGTEDLIGSGDYVFSAAS